MKIRITNNLHHLITQLIPIELYKQFKSLNYVVYNEKYCYVRILNDNELKLLIKSVRIVEGGLHEECPIVSKYCRYVLKQLTTLTLNH